jgi:hypothetical protein
MKKTGQNKDKIMPWQLVRAQVKAIFQEDDISDRLLNYVRRNIVARQMTDMVSEFDFALELKQKKTKQHLHKH